LIEQFLWQGVDQRVNELEQAGEEVLAIWDESALEKGESLKLEGLCAVRSGNSRAAQTDQTGFLQFTG